jgi:hypothetical protein
MSEEAKEREAAQTGIVSEEDEEMEKGTTTDTPLSKSPSCPLLASASTETVSSKFERRRVVEAELR